MSLIEHRIYILLMALFKLKTNLPNPENSILFFLKATIGFVKLVTNNSINNLLETTTIALTAFYQPFLCDIVDGLFMQGLFLI
jgi:hypothetical protein